MVPAVSGVRRVALNWRCRVAVTGTSMRPTLLPGDWLLVNPDAFCRRRLRRSHRCRRRVPAPGELVVIPDPRAPARWLVKRVSAVAEDGRLHLAGDDPDRSTDSRKFGTVAPTAVIGRPWLRYWPPSRAGRVR
ncbi:MAG: hypothetical protein H0V12_10385 [Chloroflexi bacterium]|nr:hypothetical protein [Chloroflexota bacterium]